jgi:hypothetical protein
VKAIRVRKRSRSGGVCFHWLLDPDRTLCGRVVSTLDVDATLELERLPGIEACRGCERALDGWAKPIVERDARQIAPPSHGKLRTSGPLSHGTRPRTGRWL